MPTIRPAQPADADAWLHMRQALWPDGSLDEHRGEIAQYFAGEFPRGPWVVLVAVDEGGGLVGFAECSIRPYAEGCESTRVAYLEGWYVEPGARRQRVGAALVNAAEQWGREQGCTEFASDAEADNDVSIAAHRALGFEDAGLVRCFWKTL